MSTGNIDLEESCSCYAGFCVLFPATVHAANFKQVQSRHQALLRLKSLTIWDKSQDWAVAVAPGRDP